MMHDREEADRVGGVRGPRLEQRVGQRAAALVDADLDDEEGRGDGEDPVAERLEPRGAHGRSIATTRAGAGACLSRMRLQIPELVFVPSLEVET